MSQGWDPDITRYFRKIISSVSVSLLWLLSILTLGLYHGLAYRSDVSVLYIILFYIFFTGTLALLIRYLYRIWSK